MERFISGARVRNRFQWLPFELVAAMKSGELVPIDPEGEEQVRLTEDENPCLYCNGKRNPNECGRGKVTCTVSSLGSGEIISQSRSCLRHYTKTSQTQELDAAIFFFSEVLAYEQAHGLKPTTTPPTPTPATEPGHDQQVVIPQIDPPESLPATAQEYNEHLRQRGYDAAIRMYMIRNAHARGKWGKMRNWTAAAIALGRPVPEESDKDEIARLNNRYYEHVTEGLRDYLPKSKKAKKKQS